MQLIWRIALVSWLLVASSLYGQEIKFEGLRNIDIDPDLTKAVGYDRLSKYLVVTADKRDQKIMVNRQLLDKVVAELITDGSVFDLIGRDLGRGDAELRDKMVGLLQSFNYTSDQADQLVAAWPKEGISESVRAVLRNASRRPGLIASFFSDYCIVNSMKWSRTLGGMDAIFEGKSPISLDLLADNVVRSRVGINSPQMPGLVSALKGGSIQARWELARGIRQMIANNGPVVRFLANSPVPEKNWNNEVWNGVMTKIIEDPLLRREYYQRLSQVAPLYDELKWVLGEVFRLDGGIDFIKDYLRGTQIPQSRFDFFLRAMMKLQPNLPQGSSYAEGDFASARIISEEMAKRVPIDDKWTMYFFWHLTRLGEGCAAITRANIPTAMSSSEAIARLITAKMGSFPPDLEKIFIIMGAYDYYGKEAIFREKIQNGTVDRVALLRYSGVVGQALAFNDDAWKMVLNSKSDRTNAILRSIFAATLEVDPNVLLTWLSVVRVGDLNLKKKFVNFLIQRGYTKDARTFDNWMESVASALQTNQMVGNSDVGDFRKWFNEFLETPEGWQAVRLRLQVETTYCPFALRDAMGDVLLRNEDVYWRIYGMLTSATGPSVTTLIPKIEQFAANGQVPQFLLEEVSARNIYAADAVDPSWDNLLSKDSPIPRKIMDIVLSGSTMSDVYNLSAQAMVGALANPKVWAQVKSVAYNHTKSPETMPDDQVRRLINEELTQQGENALPFMKVIVQDPLTYETWCKRLLSSVRYLGKSQAIADFLLRNPEFQAQWNTEISKMMARDPYSMKVVLSALVARRVGEIEWDKAMRAVRKQMIDLVTGDRVMFEQIIAGKNKEFKAAFEARMKQHVGTAQINND